MRADLVAVHDLNAFRQSLVYAELELYHVEFDQLVGGDGVEAQLRHWMTRGGRVALIARTGAGKSSTLASVFGVFGDVPDNVAPLRIPVALASEAVVRDAGAFARHVVRHVADSAQELTPAERAEVTRLTANAAVKPGRTKRRGFVLGGNLHVVRAELARDVTETVQSLTYDFDAGQAARALARLVETFRAHDVEPLFVFDDTDSWGNRPDGNLVADFFGNSIRLLATELDCGFVVAVHENYLDVPEYRALADRLEPVVLPRFDDAAGALQAILQKRLEVTGTRCDVADVLSAGAVGRPFASYETAPDLRRVLGVAALAVRKTLDDPELELVTPRAVALAESDRASHGGVLA
jgi:hypothetical protein